MMAAAKRLQLPLLHFLYSATPALPATANSFYLAVQGGAPLYLANSLAGSFGWGLDLGYQLSERASLVSCSRFFHSAGPDSFPTVAHTGQTLAGFEGRYSLSDR